ncbi:MAG TPA: DoxX family protein [Cyclobacteriaceae bacterium]|nr:DoxX family protein [Cyclobacteriaceae bacterium]
METKLPIASLLLRLGLGITFLSAVASRFGLWEGSSGWDGFLEYTAMVNSYAPKGVIPFLAFGATFLEITIGTLLIIGWKTRWVALGAALLTLVFALTMAYSFGIKNPLEYSVFVDSTAAFLLACIPSYRWSADDFFAKKHTR